MIYGFTIQYITNQSSISQISLTAWVWPPNNCGVGPTLPLPKDRQLKPTQHNHKNVYTGYKNDKEKTKENALTAIDFDFPEHMQLQKDMFPLWPTTGRQQQNFKCFPSLPSININGSQNNGNLNLDLQWNPTQMNTVCLVWPISCQTSKDLRD